MTIYILRARDYHEHNEFVVGVYSSYEAAHKARYRLSEEDVMRYVCFIEKHEVIEEVEDD